MLPSTVIHHDAVLIHVHSFRVAMAQPDWRRRRRGAHDRIDAMLVQQLNHIGKRADIDASLLRLKHRPGKFPDSHDIDSRLLHSSDILQQHVPAP
ncbi:hypothetical protein D3C77_525380 [compost metagenome]